MGTLGTGAAANTANCEHKYQFRFDVSQVWEGETKEIAESRQKQKKTSYEVEIECMQPDYFAKTKWSHKKENAGLFLMLNMILKTLDLMFIDPKKTDFQTIL